jgi:hypothetical protein
MDDPSTTDQHAKDLQADQSQALVAEAQRGLESAAIHAVNALTQIAQYGEDGPRVKAATEILDRIGVGRRPLESSVSFPPEMLAGVLAGMASMFGQRVASEALSRTARDITPRAKPGLQGPSGLRGSDGLQRPDVALTTTTEADPHAPEAPKRKRGLKHGQPANAIMALTGKLRPEEEE